MVLCAACAKSSPPLAAALPQRQLGLVGSAPAKAEPALQRRAACTGGGARRLCGRCRPAAPPLRAAHGSSSASSFDPDTYEHELEDPDDYGEAGDVPLQQRGGWGASGGSASSTSAVAAASSAAAPVAFAAGELEHKERVRSRQQRSRRRQQLRERVGSGMNALLLFTAAVDRLATRLRTAVGATAKVAWQLGAEGLSGASSASRQAQAKVQEGFYRSPVGKRVDRWQTKLKEAQAELPEDLWGKVMWVWDRPDVQKLRLTISMANFSIRLPALVALVATQIGLLSTSLSLPMLAPLLLGTGMLMRSIRTNASLVFPRIGLLVVLLWTLWFANSVIQNTVAYMRKQGAIDQRLANNINSCAELTVLVTAGVILLSMLGVNVSALLLPAGVAAALAARDLTHNFLAGFFLMMVQPFRLGDRVGVTLPAGSPGGFGGGGGAAGGSWFEGVCEKVDLRYTSLRQGRRRLMVPNAAFLQQPFTIMEEVAVVAPPPSPAGAGGGGGLMGSMPAEALQQQAAMVAPAQQHVSYQPFITHDGRHVWQAYVNGGPVHAELAGEAAPPSGLVVGGGGGGNGQPAMQQQQQQQYAPPPPTAAAVQDQQQHDQQPQQYVPPQASPSPGMQHPPQQQHPLRQHPLQQHPQQQQQQQQQVLQHELQPLLQDHQQQGQQDQRPLAGTPPEATAAFDSSVLYYTTAAPPGSYLSSIPSVQQQQQQQQQQQGIVWTGVAPPGAYPGSAAPPGAYPVHQQQPPLRSHPLPPQAFR